MRAVGDACPYSKNIRFRTNIVGDDVLGVPFIKISLRFARTTGGRPYRRCVVLSFLIVGTGVSDGPKGRFVNRPYGFGGCLKICL